MAQKTLAQLKTLWQSGYVPVQADYENLFDTLLDQNIFNVKHYGAVGDGTTDDTAAINLAIADLTDQATLFFPPGKYKTTSRLLINTIDSVSVRGQSATILPTQADSAQAVFIDADHSITVEGITIDATNSVETDTIVVLRNAVYGCSIHNLHIINASGYCLDIDGISNDPAEASNSDGVGLALTNCSFAYSIGGVRMGNTEANEYWTINNCTFTHLDTGLYLKDAGNGVVNGSHFKYIDVIGIHQAVPVSNGGKLNVVASKFNHNDGIGIQFDYVNAERPILINANQFIANADSAIKIAGHRHTITNNFFNRVGAANNYIELVSSNQNIVTNNMVYGDATYFLNGNSNDSIYNNNHIVAPVVNNVTGTGNTF